MKENIFPVIKLTLLCLIFFSGIYTFVIWGIAQFSPNKGKGEIITQAEKTYYSNISQRFTSDKYFWSRPSAVNYNPAGSGGSNKGPSNPDYLVQLEARIDTFLVHNPEVKKSEIPADIITASGGGLDPHISPQAALIQVKRIAKVRNISDEKLKTLVTEHIEKPLLSLFGTSRVNVLKINIDLDNLK